ncbi:TetR/AcrR family transcriptional regulator [Mycobacterium colombiense]|uniref:Transcriptional regulator n=1 Tax=Mycobacterium colombiense CECT 3035 TaxID=1041522 RepID=J4TIS8_9MYCO|nr:TetR family transcriptional regulator [Mycobacterium colombiense]EJO89453.1 transcriptional regulator [Mycobacterium colombiense CECT 3035]
MPVHDSAKLTTATSRRDRPATLTEDQIVDAALSVIREEGLDALSMRRLSRELGRSAMAVYWYVDDKKQLLDLVARKMLAEVALPDPIVGSWEERLHLIVDEIDAKLREHPGMAEILLERMLSTDRRLMNGIMDILLSAGFEGAEIFLTYAMIHTYLFGRYQVVLHAEEIYSMQPEDNADTVARMLPHLNDVRGRDFFAFGVRTIIAGLRNHLEAKLQT